MKKLGLTILFLTLCCFCKAQLTQASIKTKKGARFYLEASTSINTLSGNRPDKGIFFESFEPITLRIRLQRGYIGYNFCGKLEFPSQSNTHIHMGLGFMNTGFLSKFEQSFTFGILSIKEVTVYNFLLYHLGTRIATTHFSITPELGVGFVTKSTKFRTEIIDDEAPEEEVSDLVDNTFAAFFLLSFSKEYRLNKMNLILGVKMYSSLTQMEALEARTMGLGILVGWKI